MFFVHFFLPEILAVKMELQNYWDAHHPKLTVTVSIVRNTERAATKFYRSVLAKKQCKYFEITVHRRAGSIYVGYAPKSMPLKFAVGRYAGSFSYQDNGTLRGHVFPGCAYADGVPFREKFLEFGVNSVVGCGLNETGRVVYTRNGQRLDTGDLYVDPSAELFPCISMVAPFDEIEGNFGPNFVYQAVDDI